MNKVDLALLIVAYKRPNEVRKILDVAAESDIRRVYISVDGHNNQDEQKSFHSEFLSITREFAHKFENLALFLREENVGCAPAVLSSVDWVFNKETFVAILEDDCIPANAFFAFCRNSLDFLNTDASLMLSCGSQFAPKELTRGHWAKSPYALTWGWATSRAKWLELRELFHRNSEELNRENLFQVFFSRTHQENQYWNAGSRRALMGKVDVWDTILVRNLFVSHRYALLPPSSLVSNVGNDNAATHTKNSPWLHAKVSAFHLQHEAPKPNHEVDFWLRKEFFRIRPRHQITTRFTSLVDLFTQNRNRLIPKWEASSIEKEKAL